MYRKGTGQLSWLISSTGWRIILNAPYYSLRGYPDCSMRLWEFIAETVVVSEPTLPPM